MELMITENEYKFIKMLGIGRHFLKDIVIPDRNIERWANTQQEADTLGVMGEYVVSKYLKIPFDTTINLEGDGGHTDMYLGEWELQVKTSKYNSARLVFNTKEEIKALLYVLIICDEQSRRSKIIGYITRKDVFNCIYEEDLGYGIRYCVNQSSLKPISDLLFYYNQTK